MCAKIFSVVGCRNATDTHETTLTNYSYGRMNEWTNEDDEDKDEDDE